ncbi:MAG: class I SAM-dependent methyltransferase [Treponema sp.]|nr:class I SAM-dependent methyltransferase [Treponema sp.]MCL2271280.1 class I SAM-dependent methyltransferase [Treponema sp.]
MKRNSIIHKIFKDICPPFIRDNEKLMCFLARATSNKNVINFIKNFRKELPYKSENELQYYYEKLFNYQLQTKNDLNVGADCINFILKYSKNHKKYQSYLDCACGGGELSFKLAELGLNVTGMDFIINDDLKISKKAVFIEGNILNIPFNDNYFDVVISGHTLEHIINIQKAISELRRVTKYTLIIIVPCQREYRYTFDLHVHFFPYPESFHRIMQNPNGKCFMLDNDIIYIEEKLI